MSNFNHGTIGCRVFFVGFYFCVLFLKGRRRERREREVSENGNDHVAVVVGVVVVVNQGYILL